MEKTETESYKEKLIQLFLEQKKTLDLFLERGAISKLQHDKCLRDLIAKMDIDWSDPELKLTDDERIDYVSKKLMRKYHKAFVELAK